MITRSRATLAYAVFLIGFATFKYLSAAPETFDTTYLFSVAVLIVLTGVLPYLLARFAGARAGGSGAAWAVALVTSLVACCLAYATYWAFFIAPQNLGIPVEAVAMRGIYAGTIEGVLAALWATARKA